MRRGEHQVGPASTALSTVLASGRLVLGAAVVAAVVVGGASALAAPVYTTSTQVVLSDNQDFDPLGVGSYVEPNRFVSTQITLMSSGEVVGEAASALADGTTSDELSRSLSVSASATADVLFVQASAPTAQQAADRVDAVVEAYQDVVLAAVAEEAAAATEVSTDPAQVAAIQVAEAAYGNGVLAADAAVPPAEPAAPRPLRNALVAALLAALAVAVLALVRRGRPVGGADALARAAGAPVLGDVPVPGRKEVQAGGALAPTVADAAMAAAALGHLTAHSPTAGGGAVVVVSGARPGSGSASAALGLARASAETRGLRVLLVDLDGRGQEVLRHRGALAPRAAVDALSRPGVPVSEVVTRVGPGIGVLRGQLQLATHSGEEGATDRGAVLVPVLRRLAEEFDLVVVRTGAVASDPVAFAVLAAADHLVLVAGQGATPADVRVAVDRAAVAGTPVTGLLLTHRRPRRADRQQDPGALPPTPTPVETSRPQSAEQDASAAVPAQSAGRVGGGAGATAAPPRDA